MRLFLAFTPAPALLKEIRDYTYRLTKELEGWIVRIPPPENIHMTLAFMGSCSPDKIPTIKDLLKIVSLETRKFKLRVGPTCFFPSEKKISGAWVSLEAGKTLIALKKRLDEELQNLKIFQPRPGKFKPHLTIMRVKKRGNISETCRSYMKNYCFENLMKCSAIELFESKTLPSGAVYRKIFSVDLK